MVTEKYGRWYYCVKVTGDVAVEGEIYVMADKVKVNEDGSVAFIQRKSLDDMTIYESVVVNLLIPAGKWLAVYAASMIDGSAVAVERWTGEVEPRS